ncbi:hypothetical protein ACJMK2_037665 [Sinanodonta woodiana]|uniref:Serine palmitoyltransferase small subunit B n=1 Tax=Sinanodonta woodiana TaxID=1069815 RepID=A0ABD3WQD9_SINWO
MAVTSAFIRLRDFVAYWYFQWTLASTVYVMEPTEKAIVNTLAVFVLTAIVYAAISYLPGHVIMLGNTVQHTAYIVSSWLES